MSVLQTMLKLSAQKKVIITRKIASVTIAVVLLIVITGVIWTRSSAYNLPQKIPDNIPVISGKVVTYRATRSDDFTRGIEIVILADLPYQKVVDYYRQEFKVKGVREYTAPSFPISPYSTETDGMGELNGKQLVVKIQSEGQNVKVTVQVKGNSVFFLPT